MSRPPFSASRPRRGGTFRPQFELLEHRLAPGSLAGAMGPSPDPDLAFLAGLAADQSHGPIVTTSPVKDFATQSIVFGESILMRTDNGVTAHLTASGLAPGVYTFWMRVDAPGVGHPVAGRLAGHMVGENGILNFAAHVRVGEVLAGHPVLPSGPLQDPLHATIRLVVRSHGPVDPGHVFEQTHSYQPELGLGPPDFLISIHTPPP